MKYGTWIFAYCGGSDRLKFRSAYSDSLDTIKELQEGIAMDLIGDDRESFFGFYPVKAGGFSEARADFRNRVVSFKERSITNVV